MSVSSCDSSTNSDVRSLLMWFHWNLIKNRARTSSAKRQSCLQSIFNSISRPIKSLFRFPFFSSSSLFFIAFFSHHSSFSSSFVCLLMSFIVIFFRFFLDFTTIYPRFYFSFTSIVLRFSHQVIQRKKQEWMVEWFQFHIKLLLY